MAETFDMIVRGGTVVNHDGRAERDIGIRGGRIAAIGALARASAADTIDAKGLHVLPGVIDTQVHFREPGLEHKEDLETGSRAAVMGGVTAVFEMPNTKPLTTLGGNAGRQGGSRAGPHVCDYAFYVGGTRENIDAHLGAGAAAGRRPASRCSWARPPATCWSTTTLRSRASSARFRAAQPSMQRTRRG